MDDIKHYGITFQGPNFIVHCIRPAQLSRIPVFKGQGPNQTASTQATTSDDALGKPSLIWHGCIMTRLAQSDCGERSGVKSLESWINEIHHWGLTAHAESVQRDIKIMIQNSGVDVSTLE